MIRANQWVFWWVSSHFFGWKFTLPVRQVTFGHQTRRLPTLRFFRGVLDARWMLPAPLRLHKSSRQQHWVKIRFGDPKYGENVQKAHFGIELESFSLLWLPVWLSNWGDCLSGKQLEQAGLLHLSFWRCLLNGWLNHLDSTERLRKNVVLIFEQHTHWPFFEARYQNRLASAKIRDYLVEQLPQQDPCAENSFRCTTFGGKLRQGRNKVTLKHRTSNLLDLKCRSSRSRNYRLLLCCVGGFATLEAE